MVLDKRNGGLTHREMQSRGKEVSGREALLGESCDHATSFFRNGLQHRRHDKPVCTAVGNAWKC